MLVVLTQNQLLLPQQVCQTCLLADQQGQPRWKRGRLLCGSPVAQINANQAPQYQCRMGFRIANVE